MPQSAPAPGLAEAADDLYGLPPAQFTAERDARAKEVRAAGRRDEAAQIRKLARPTTSAWLVNQLARQAPEQMGALYELGDALARAQQNLAGDQLRELSVARRRVVSDLLPLARSLAGQAGQPASAAVLDEVRATLEAAVADAAARDAVRTGRLTRALAYAGLGEVDLSAALAVPAARPSEETAPDRGERKPAAKSRRSPKTAEPAAEPAEEPPDESAAEAERAERKREAAAKRAAERRRAQAQDAVDAASEAVTSAAEAVAAVRQQRQFLRRRIAHLERELAGARAEDDRLVEEEIRATESQEAAGNDLAAAQAALRDATGPDC